ncbi:VOC family protein [Leifsonia sp. NPDC058292]|uniref:VOC family protein n=1 Tax=Leifsonia sp. NPDC058292 TaxID=3346428 RepID=UPI0036D7FE71
MQFASIRIITSDVDRLAEFYERVTGVAPLRPAPIFAQFDTDGGTIAIASSQTVAMLGEAAPQPASNASVIVEFLVDDVDTEFERLRSGLTDVVLEPTTMPWGNRSVMFRDPDGNLVNLFTRPAA